jgi:5-methylcytosine-specific restriction endonuclease McrA
MQTTNKDSRQKRFETIKDLLIPFLVAKDSRRGFNEDERRIVWVKSDNKKCAICGKTISDYTDYELDHKIPHSKGGKTELKNAQITHKICNAKKSNNQSTHQPKSNGSSEQVNQSKR